MDERETRARRALETRVDEAQGKLDSERLVAQYLHETGRDSAAKRAEDNILRMEKTVQKFRDELGNSLGIPMNPQ